MSDWNKLVTSVRSQLSMNDLMNIIDPMPETLIVELIIEILADENPKINGPVKEWLRQYSSGEEK